VDVVGEDQLIDADAILVSVEGRADMILKDLEFVETRLGREPQPAERQALKKIQALLEQEKFVFNSGLAPEDLAGRRRAQLFHRQADRGGRTGGFGKSRRPAAARVCREGGYICFLTVGGKENRAWPIRKGTTAWEAGGTIHTDIQKGFIRAEIISYADLIEAGGETQAKRANKMRLETKQYVMQDYDLTNFRFNK
jgi:ribosome-binding ATPase YchF (GTP1/OBG family)